MRAPLHLPTTTQKKTDGAQHRKKNSMTFHNPILYSVVYNRLYIQE